MNPNTSLKLNLRFGLMFFTAPLLLSAPMIAPAAVLFGDNFDTNSSSLWTVNYAPAANASVQSATFAFDYSPFGIPPVPGSTNTLGLRLRSNIPIVGGVEITTRPAGVLSGLSVSPAGKNFGGSYHLSFYAWANFNGSPSSLYFGGLGDNGTSEGGTHNVLFAVGTSGTVPLVVGNTAAVPGSTIDGIAFATTGDGGITDDYRAYLASSSPAAAASGIYAAGTGNDTNGVSPRGNVNVYYQGLPSLARHAAPAIQQTLSSAEYSGDEVNTQSGQTQIGSFGFAWHKVDIIKSNNIVRWTIDDAPIATADISAVTLGGSNIALGDSDVNTTTTRHPSLLFTLIDNLVVVDLAEPVIQSSVSNGNIQLSWLHATGGNFVLQSAGNLSPPDLWSNVVATITTNSGILSVSLPATNSQRFFRLKQ